jgi:hypothetical protein
MLGKRYRYPFSFDVSHASQTNRASQRSRRGGDTGIGSYATAKTG